MDPDGNNVRRLTDEIGYDGGAFFSQDGKKICYRAIHPETEEQKADYQALLAKGLVRPTRMEHLVMDADGSNKVRLTDNGAANFCPFFHPSGKKIIFTSNLDDPKGRNFDIYHDRHGREEPRAGDLRRELRRIPDVLPRRPQAGILFEPGKRASG